MHEWGECACMGGVYMVVHGGRSVHRGGWSVHRDGWAHIYLNSRRQSCNLNGSVFNGSVFKGSVIYMALC